MATQRTSRNLTSPEYELPSVSTKTDPHGDRFQSRARDTLPAFEQSVASLKTTRSCRGLLPMLLSCFDEVRVINLASRKDRRREMEAQISGFTFFPAVRPDSPEPFLSSGVKGAFLSHLGALREARGSILILEDDCDLLPEAWTYVVPDDCEIFYGGYHADDPDDLEHSTIVGAHCMGFSAKAAKMAADYLEGLLDPTFPPDPTAMTEPMFDPDIRPPVDGAYIWFRRAHPELKTVFKQLAVQRSSRSDITPRHVFDRIWGIKHLADFARSKRRA